jgi:opacity protein-like surface antigen
MKVLKPILLALMLFYLTDVNSQIKNFEFSGYLSGLHSTGYDDVYDDWSSFNKINNRVNLQFWASSDFTIKLEVQNRLYNGSYLSRFPEFSSSLTSAADYLNLSHIWSQQSSTVIQSRVDRLYVDYTKGGISLRIGRQRINWGQTLVWNVTDIFNSYSVFEIDNLEKYGCDAMRLSFFASPASVVEAAVKVNADKKITSAIMSRINYNEIDYQIQAGLVDEADIMIGSGITSSFRGFTLRTEGAYYIPIDKDETESSTLLICVGLDYVFSNNMAVQGEVLYNQLNNKGLNELFEVLFVAPVAAKTLSISEWNYALNYLYPASPRLNLSLSSLFFADYSGFYLSPSVDFKLIKNLDLTALCQLYSLEYYGERNMLANASIRLKYHF